MFIVRCGIISCAAALLCTVAIAQSPDRAASAPVFDDLQESQRLGNRWQYYDMHAWMQLDSWISSNHVAPALAVSATNGQRQTADQSVIKIPVSATKTTAFPEAVRAESAEPGTRAPFGFNSAGASTDDQNWFYDFYTINPTYHLGPRAEALYGSALRYYDLNSDGVFDSLSHFRDSDSNGSYDVYDRFDFADAENLQQHTELSGPISADRHSINGTVDAIKVARVNGTENLVVRVVEPQAIAGTDVDPMIPIVIDLGPRDRWQALNIVAGDQLTATGVIETIGAKQALISETVTVGKQKQVRVSRMGSRIDGWVVDITRAPVKDVEHLMAIVESDTTRHVVDLGPAEKLENTVAPQTHIAVQGLPVQLGGHRVILADKISLGGQAISIQRW